LQARAKILIDVPPQARLYVDNKLMPMRSGQRTFLSPPLEPGSSYYYDVKIVTLQDGREQIFSDRVVIRRGDVVAASVRPGGGIAVASAK
jgi:uncharacterized protein (TIGR03000 family)